MARTAVKKAAKTKAAKKPARKAAARKAPTRKASARGKLATYGRKRDFTKTAEPPPERKSSTGGNSYLIQKHDARRLHYDFRLELDGVLLSWAIPKGPSLDPADKRLAVRTEDHPLDYGKFEGTIPAGEYGGGTVMLWDRGTWSWTKDPRKWLKRGQLEFELHGERLTGNWVLTRLKNRRGESDDKENWLLIKRRDDVAKEGKGTILIDTKIDSVVTGRSMDKIAKGSDVWVNKKARKKAPDVKTPKKATAKKPATEKKARPKIDAPSAKLPDFVTPQLATLVAEAPGGENWIHEIKFDGYRTQARIENGKVRMLTRSGLDWTAKFKPIAGALAALPAKSALIDGEIVVSTAGGTTNFGDLQEALSEGRSERLSYYMFDLLHLDGKDLRKLPLIERKEALRACLDGLDERYLRYSDHFTDRGPDFFHNACRLALEGIVSKRGDAPYTSGRGKAWLKIKCTKRQEFVVGGWRSSTKAGRDLRSLLVGYYRDGKLIYAGRVGTGFNARNTAELLSLFKKHTNDKSPFADVPREVARGVNWVKPQIVVEVEFGAWTNDHIIRHSSVEGVREDKDPQEVVLELPVDPPKSTTTKPAKREYGGIALTHPDRVLWPDCGVTKEALADYYASVAELMLPHIADRPLSLLRCPDGAAKKCFFQRHMGQGLPKAVKPVKVRGEKEPYLAIRDEAGLFSLIQFSTLELHPWGSRVDDIEHPDRIIMDFDPGDAVAWSKISAGAVDCRDRLADLGLTSFIKTTGGKGLHVVIPIDRRHDWAEVKEFASALASSMAADDQTYVTRMAKNLRHGKIFIDYLRNDRTATGIAPYSTRARDGAPVALPIDWDELKSLPASNHYTVTNVGRRLAAMKHDPWADMNKVKQRLTAKAKKAVGLK